MKKLIPYFLMLIIIAACDTKREQEEQRDEATTGTEKTDDKIAKTQFEDVEIEVLKVEPVRYIGMEADVQRDNIEFLGNTITESFGKIVNQIDAEHAPDTVKVMSIYRSFGVDEIELVIAMQIGDEQSEQRRRNGVFKYSRTGGGYAVKGIHKGSYENLLDTHDKIKKFINRENLEIQSYPYEIYVTGPSQQQNDTANWVTEIYYPINDKDLK